MSAPYGKTLNIFKRDPENKSRILVGEWMTPWLERLQDLEWTGTEKVDGTNIRIIWDPLLNRVEFKPRKSDDPQNIPGRLREYLEHKRAVFECALAPVSLDHMVTLYGEGYGAGTHKNGHHYGEDQRFIAFDLKCGGVWLPRAKLVEVAVAAEIPVVPEVFWGTLSDAVYEAQNGGFDSQLTDGYMEGIILRPPVELSDAWGNRVQCKLKFSDLGIVTV